MRVLILKNNIAEAISSVERATSQSGSLSSLKNFHIATIGGKVVVTATNLELAIRATVSGKVMESGSCSVPASVVAPVLKNIPAERVTLEWKDRVLIIRSDNYEARVPGSDPKEFPIIPAISEGVPSVTLPVGVYRDSFESVVVAAQYSEIRPEISGVYLKFDGDAMVFAATDSFRLSEWRMGNEKFSARGESSAIIPLRASEESLRVFSDRDEELSIAVDQGQIFFETPTRSLVSRLIDGVFPDYHAIIPHKTKSEIMVSKTEFIAGIKLVSSLSGKGNDITVRVREGEKGLELVAGDGGLGENEYALSGKVKGEPFSVVFNWKYLLDGLRVFKGSEITLGVNSAGPALLLSHEDPNLQYVVMPIRA